MSTIVRGLLFRIGIVLLGGAVVLPAMQARAAELGDAAAALQVAEWVKGKPVDLAAGKGKQVFVVEFWATWCPPCRASIPHLTKLQKKYKDVVFVGISDEKADVVKKFVTQMGDAMDYVVALDADGKTSAAYMGAFGQTGIPHAFIVDREGRVAWHGHPMGEIDRVLDEVVAGKFDLAVSKRRARGMELIEKFVKAVSEGRADAEIEKLGREIEVIDKEVGGLVDGRKFETAEVKKAVKFEEAMTAYQKALFGGAGEGETKKLADAARKLAPKEVDFAEIMLELDAQQLVQQYMKAVSANGDESKAAELGRKLGALKVKNVRMLNSIAWMLLADETIVKRDLPLALKVAKSAYDGCEGKDVMVVDTYARALFDNGQTDEAIKFQKKALELAADKDAGVQADLAATLKKYEAAGAKPTAPGSQVPAAK